MSIGVNTKEKQMLSLADRHASLSALREDGLDWMTLVATWPSTSYGLLEKFNRDGSSLRTSQVSSRSLGLTRRSWRPFRREDMPCVGAPATPARSPPRTGPACSTVAAGARPTRPWWRRCCSRPESSVPPSASPRCKSTVTLPAPPTGTRGTSAPP